MIIDSVNSISPLFTILSIRKYLMTHHRMEDVSQILSNIMTSSTFYILYSIVLQDPASISVSKPTISKKQLNQSRASKMASTAVTILICSLLSQQALSLQSPIHSSDVVPKKFFVEPSNLANIAASSTSMVARLGSGAFVDGYNVKIIKETDENSAKYAVLDGEVLKGYRVEETTTSVFDRRPAQLIELYEFEGCPFCRKVREAVAILDLDVLFYPCPKGSTIYRPMVEKMGGKAQFPYMKDPNTGVSIYESDDIIQYMFDTYGPVGSKVPSSLTSGILTTLTCGVALLPRRGRGSKKTESKQPKQPLIYWGYESSPFCKVVREKLVELEIPHIQKTCARGSSKRQAFLEKKGIFQVPYIEDPDTGVTLFESVEIIKYLDKTYNLEMSGL